jgi:hypothetical protein
MIYFCCDERRREVVKLHSTLNGLEYLEVHDSGVPGDAMRQLTLFAKFLRPVPALTTGNVCIEGGERIKAVDIEWVAIADALPPGEPPSLVNGLTPLNEFLVIRTEFYGDFSIYTLRLVSGPGRDTPPAGFDPRLSEIRFSFKAQCKSDFDCTTLTPCPAAPAINPRLDYLAKDYASLRRLMLDRMSVLMPEWRSRNAANIGVMLVELLAYVGDQLSYQQDAVATEAYLGTARKRVSLRRLARLVDYLVHEGCNARVWVRVFTNDGGVNIPRGTQLLTRAPGIPDRIAPNSGQLREALARGVVVFETVEDTLVYRDHERITFYTWGERECCLPKGATHATLAGHYPNLKAGDVLVFAEELGPRTGLAEDADRSHCWAVRLTHVRLDQDTSGGLFLPEPNNNPLNVTEIAWEDADALPFPLCLSTRTDEEVYLESVSAAYGNIVLADHGRTIADEDLGAMPEPRMAAAPQSDTLSCERPQAPVIPQRYHPVLKERPLTHALSLHRRHLFAMTTTPTIVADLQARTFSPAVQRVLQAHDVVLEQAVVIVQGGEGHWSVADGAQAYWLRLESATLQVYAHGEAAIRMTAAAPRAAHPAITLNGTFQSQMSTWQPRPDLLASDASKAEFVVESEHEGRAYIRFGDDVHGKRPEAGTQFTATYRIGNGAAGNIGLESIGHVVSNDDRVVRAVNPLPAQGGVDAENAEDIKRDAPEAFRTQERAVTPEDYAAVTERHASVQRAASTFRWSGSWHTVFLTVDRKGGGEVDTKYEQTIRDHVERYRMAGYDLEVEGPRYVPLELGMTVCVKQDYFRGDVRAALVRVFSRGWLPDGRPAVFHPDNFTFGQPVYLSALYEAAQVVEGVASVVIETFRRLHAPPDSKPLEEGVLTLSRLEVARLDNDPNFPERGVLKLSVGGGK